MIYCDTSLIVSIITTEVHSDIARAWYFGGTRPAGAISSWSRTEVASALALKHRRGVIDDAGRRAAEAAWDALDAEMAFVAVTEPHFQRAIELVDAAPRGLRSGDALHLAIVLDTRCALATFDHDLADAARALGVAVHPA